MQCLVSLSSVRWRWRTIPHQRTPHHIITDARCVRLDQVTYAIICMILFFLEFLIIPDISRFYDEKFHTKYGFHTQYDSWKCLCLLKKPNCERSGVIVTKGESPLSPLICMVCVGGRRSRSRIGARSILLFSIGPILNEIVNSGLAISIIAL